MSTSACAVGDFVRAFCTLAPGDPRLERRLAELICPELLDRGPLPGLEPALDSTGLMPRRPRPSPDEAAPAAPRTGPLGASGDDEPTLATDLVRLDESEPTPEPTPEAFAAVASFEPLVEVEPLFVARKARALLGAMVSRLRNEGELDLARVVEILSRGQILEAFPRKPIRALRGCVRVLVDQGVAMQPFAIDQRDVIARLQDVVGQALVEILYFEDCPTRGTESQSSEAARQRTPSAGTVVLVLSDFGAARPSFGSARARTGEWLSFGRELARAGCPTVGLSPYPASRLARDVARAFRVVHWDRRTSAGAAHEALQHRVAR